jgi:hypothetical protein
MPLVIVRYKADLNPRNKSREASERRLFFRSRLLIPLGDCLPFIVAEALDVPSRPEARLTADDIAVSFIKAGELDRNVIDFSITIDANDYPERRVNLEGRKQVIIEKLSDFIPYGTAVSVWVRLLPGAYGIFGVDD